MSQASKPLVVFKPYLRSQGAVVVNVVVLTPDFTLDE